MPPRDVVMSTGQCYRIRVGQTIAGDVFSNTAITIIGRFRIIYDDGTPDEWFVQDQASGSSRAQVVWLTGHKAPQDGWVVGGALTYKEAYIQRGQCYIRAVIADPANLANYSDVLMRDYLSQSVTLGRNVDSGPAGGHGNLREIITADPAAAAEIANQVVPTGALWKLRLFSVQLVQGITQTPLPALRFQTTTPTEMARIPAMTTALGASTTAQLTWGIGLVLLQFLAVVGDEMYTIALPDCVLQSGDIIQTVTDGIGANTNYGAALMLVEEWVMPN